MQAGGTVYKYNEFIEIGISEKRRQHLLIQPLFLFIET
jgi:hypothetical protein